MHVFASDNYAGICPEALTALQQANDGHATPYGGDEWTKRADAAFNTLFGTDCQTFYLFNGTAANSLALAALAQSYQGIICAGSAHVQTDECGAPGFFSNGATLMVAPMGPDKGMGKLTPDAVRSVATARTDLHAPRARAVTITQPTETGQIYTVAEIAALSATCRALGLRLHMDGSRFANACAALNCNPAEISWQAGVDVLCFGGTKNGMPMGEAVVFFDPDLARDFDYRCKQAGQLASKMRFLTAPWVGMIESGAWLKNAAHANRCARHFAARLADNPAVDIMFPVEANAVFVQAPANVLHALREKGWMFYDFIGCGARFMFPWDADLARVDALADDIRHAAQNA